MADDELLPVLSFGNLMSEGIALSRRGQHEKALGRFNDALKLRGADKHCLITRSKCFLRLGDTENSLKDAEASLQIDDTFYEGLYQKAESLYAMGDFEFALVFYHRGRRLRPDLHKFLLGIHKAEEAIINCIGMKLENKEGLCFVSRQAELQSKKDSQKQQKKPKDQKDQKHTKKKSPKTEQQLLGRLYDDKAYLEKLLKDEDLMQSSTRQGTKVMDLVMGGISYLNQRRDFWQQQKPMYAREYERKLLRLGWGRDRKLKPAEIARAIAKEMEDIEQTEHLLKKIRAWSEDDVPNKYELIGNLHSCIGNAQLAMGQMEAALHSHKMDLECAREHSLTDSVSRALDNIGHVYARLGKFQQAISTKMSTQSAKERPESLHFPFLDDEDTISTLKESKTFFILRGLPGSGKSTLAQAIHDRYKDACKVISVDHYKITPLIRSSIPEEYSKVDEDLVDYCKREISVIVLDDTHHERERLEQLFDIADKYRYKVIFAEPKTPWRLDCPQLKDKNQWKLSVEELKKMKPSLEKEFLPMYFGWFLSKRSSEILRKAGQAFLDELGSLKAFKKESKYFPSAIEDPKIKTDLTSYFVKRPPGVLHCTTKYTEFGKAAGAEEYAQQEAVKASYGKGFTLSISALFITTKTVGARIELSEQQLLLWPGDADKILPTDNLPRGSRAHITLGCANGVEAVQTGLDLLEFVKLEKAGNKGEQVGEIGGGKLLYFDNGMWMLVLLKKIDVRAIFSGWEEKIPLAQSSLEKAWLFHEIGRCYLELDNAEVAQDYGEQSLQSADEEGDVEWQLHATVLVAQAQVKLKNYPSAILNFERALEKARLLPSETAQNGIIAALDNVSKSLIAELNKGQKDGAIPSHEDRLFSRESIKTTAENVEEEEEEKGNQDEQP
ncbi:hypothetical protein EK904_012389 [Melospiza melodia maxima]|nr:hypothetical protein EK904_012389 [Melospiza melodia maxima]